MAASEANRDMVYYTFKDAKTVNYLTKIQNIIQSKELTVGKIYEILVEYNCQIQHLKEAELKSYNIYEFLIHIL
jgi:hypothetical protein